MKKQNKPIGIEVKIDRKNFQSRSQKEIAEFIVDVSEKNDLSLSEVLGILELIRYDFISTSEVVENHDD